MDRRQRELARAAAAGGSLEDRARSLAARLRAGELGADALRVAAHAGDPAARLVVGHPGCPACEERGWLPGEHFGRPGEQIPCAISLSFSDWCVRLGEAGAAVVERAVVASLRRALEVQADEPELVRALVAWWDDPARVRLEALTERVLAGPWSPIRLVLRRAASRPIDALDRVARISSEDAVREAVLREVIPWLLREPALESASASPLPRLESGARPAAVRLEGAEAVALARVEAWLERTLAAAAGRLASAPAERRQPVTRESLRTLLETLSGPEPSGHLLVQVGQATSPEPRRPCTWAALAFGVREGDALVLGIVDLGFSPLPNPTQDPFACDGLPTTRQGVLAQALRRVWPELGGWIGLSPGQRASAARAWAQGDSPDRTRMSLAVARALLAAGAPGG